MKKILALLLAIFMMFSLIACGTGEGATQGGSVPAPHSFYVDVQDSVGTFLAVVWEEYNADYNYQIECTVDGEQRIWNYPLSRRWIFGGEGTYSDFKIFYFRDNNGNGMFDDGDDKGEEVYANTTVEKVRIEGGVRQLIAIDTGEDNDFGESYWTFDIGTEFAGKSVEIHDSSSKYGDMNLFMDGTIEDDGTITVPANSEKFDGEFSDVAQIRIYNYTGDMDSGFTQTVTVYPIGDGESSPTGADYNDESYIGTWKASDREHYITLNADGTCEAIYPGYEPQIGTFIEVSPTMLSISFDDGENVILLYDGTVKTITNSDRNIAYSPFESEIPEGLTPEERLSEFKETVIGVWTSDTTDYVITINEDDTFTFENASDGDFDGGTYIIEIEPGVGYQVDFDGEKYSYLPLQFKNDTFGVHVVDDRILGNSIIILVSENVFTIED